MLPSVLFFSVLLPLITHYPPPLSFFVSFSFEILVNTWLRGDKEVFKATFLSTLTNRVQIENE
jgi:hypothetical protein